MHTFDFCPNSRVISESAPEEAAPINLNRGYSYAPKPNAPYQRNFSVALYVGTWYLGQGGLDLSTNSERNAGRLLKFYREHRLYRPFILRHEYLGAIQCRFAAPVNLDPGESDSNGVIGKVEIKMIHHNPGYEK